MDWQQLILFRLSEQSRAERIPLHQAFSLAEKAVAEGRREAEFFIYQLLKQQPGFNEAYAVYVGLLEQASRHDDQVGLCRRWIKESPQHIPAYMSLSQAMHRLGDHAGAIQAAEGALGVRPDDVRLLNHLGVLKKEAGELDEALTIFNRCIAQQSDFAPAYWNRADLYKTISSGEVAEMEALYSRAHLKDEDRIYFSYALAHGLERLEDYERSFYYLTIGSRLKRQSLTYNHAAAIKELKDIPQYFAPSLFHDQQSGLKTAAPIFICGLPRSGTTLVEQIISSHPDITGGEELMALSTAVASVLQTKAMNLRYPLWTTHFNREDWKQIGTEYLALTQRLQKTNYFTDKMLMNYKALGVIHLALPNAKIIHCTRDPLDNMFGCYKQLFDKGLRFTYDLDELADTYEAYAQVMAHWKTLFPANIIDVRYESLVTDPETETRRLLDFIGLSWNPACLDFYNNKRPVYSASNSQVRQPIFTSSIGQWRNHAEAFSSIKNRLNLPD